jgi:hypothetical protein
MDAVGARSRTLASDCNTSSWMRGVRRALLLALLAAGCGSDGDTTESAEPGMDVDREYRANPPEHSAIVLTVPSALVGDEPATVPVFVWNLGTASDRYELSTIGPDGSLGLPASLSDTTVELAGGALAEVALTIGPGMSGSWVGIELASPHLPSGEGARIALVPGGPHPLPLLSPDEVTTGREEAVTIDVLANEAGADASEIDPSTLVGRMPVPGTGTFSVTTDHELRFEPFGYFSGTATGLYTVCTTEGACNAATIEVTITEE